MGGREMGTWSLAIQTDMGRVGRAAAESDGLPCGAAHARRSRLPLFGSRHGRGTCATNSGSTAKKNAPSGKFLSLSGWLCATDMVTIQASRNVGRTDA